MKKEYVYGISVMVSIFIVGMFGYLYSETNTIKNNHIAHLEEKLAKFDGGEWVCQAKTCSEWDYGDDWIVANCRPDENNDLVCKTTYEDREVYAPLYAINTSQMKSCKTYTCVFSIYAKNPMEVI